MTDQVPSARLNASSIENQWLHRPKIKNYITEGAKNNKY